MYYPAGYQIIGRFDCSGNWYRVIIIDGIGYILLSLKGA